jgi:hypothetical protein
VHILFISFLYLTVSLESNFNLFLLKGNNNPSNSLAGGSVSGAKVPPLIREFVQSLDDKEWQSALFGLLQSQVS